MQAHRLPGLAIVPVLLLAVFIAAPPGPALAQDAGAVISVDTPSDAQTAELGQTIEFRGWAAHRDGAGTGVDRVTVLDAPVGAGGQPVAEATYGSARSDVGATYEADWTNSGFRAAWRASGSTGNRTFWVYAHSLANDGWTNKTVTLRLVEATQPRPPMADQYRDRWGMGSQYGMGAQVSISPQYFAGSQYGMGSPYGMGSQYGIGMGQGYGYNQFGGSYPFAGAPPFFPPGGSVAGIQIGTLMPPLAVSIAGITNNSVALTWTPSLSPGVTHYQVLQSFSPLGPFTPAILANISMTGATVGGLNPGTTSYFEVAAVIAGGGISPPSAPVAATTTP